MGLGSRTLGFKAVGFGVMMVVLVLRVGGQGRCSRDPKPLNLGICRKSQCVEYYDFTYIP